MNESKAKQTILTVGILFTRKTKIRWPENHGIRWTQSNKSFDVKVMVCLFIWISFSSYFCLPMRKNSMNGRKRIEIKTVEFGRKTWADVRWVNKDENVFVCVCEQKITYKRWILGHIFGTNIHHTLIRKRREWRGDTGVVIKNGKSHTFSHFRRSTTYVNWNCYY